MHSGHTTILASTHTHAHNNIETLKRQDTISHYIIFASWSASTDLWTINTSSGSYVRSNQPLYLSALQCTTEQAPLINIGEVGIIMDCFGVKGF